MKLIKILITIVMVFSGLSLVNAQCNRTDTLWISSGINSFNNTVIPVGTPDPNWRLINLPPLNDINGTSFSSGNIPSVNMGTAWVIPSYNGVNWNAINPLPTDCVPGIEARLSALNTCNLDSNNTFTTQPFRFIREFCVLDSTELVHVCLLVKGDDAATVTIFDASNNQIDLPFSTNLGYGPSTILPPIHQDNFDNSPARGWPIDTIYTLPPGNYSIEVRLLNRGRTAMGFALSGFVRTISGNNNLSNDQRCCDVGTIGIFKVHDNNCNGQLEAGIDTTHSNVTFNLRNSSNNIVASSQTDNNGELFFYNVPFGTYSIQEVVPIGFSPFTAMPSNIILDNNTQSFYFTLFNCPADPFDCCETNLMIYVDPPDTIAPQVTKTINGTTLSLATENVGIHQDAAIPITQIKASITDIIFDYAYDDCETCLPNPAHWASLVSETNTIGTMPNDLTHQSSTYAATDLNNLIQSNGTVREQVWKNPLGAMLKDGDSFQISYVLPPASEIPCCATYVTICTRISWKDANCNECEINNCTVVDLSSAPN